MENKMAIAIVALMVAALVAPGVMADVTYTASVVTSDVIVTPLNAAFGDLLVGASTEITNSLKLENNGGADANVDAKFTSNDGGTPTAIYGLTTTSNDVIPAVNFMIGIDTHETALENDGTDKALGPNNQIPAATTVNYDAKLTVPGTQATGDYNGIVQLTFTAVAP